MKSYNECIPCMFRQALHSARMAVEAEDKRSEIMQHVAKAIRDIDMRQSPPVMAQRIHRIIREMSRNNDPYRKVKDRLNRAALDLYPALKKRAMSSAHSFETAVRLAIAGNLMDCGVNSEMDAVHVKPCAELAFTEPLAGDAEALLRAASEADSILYLADNAGEVVFDRLLVEFLPREKLAVAVRGTPVINDATLDDAKVAGLLDVVEVLENGSDAPGTILDDCSEEFKERFAAADLVIAKGQGNYETLSDFNKDIFFLLKVKCPVISRDIGRNVGDMVIKRRSAIAEVAKGGGDLARI